MKGYSQLLPLAMFASITMFLLFPVLTLVRHPPIETTLHTEVPIRQCDHILLVSAPRHGSTWFLDSVEGCPSAQTERSSYQQLISNTELWTGHEGPVHDLTPFEAANYVLKNCSVKLFPTLERRGGERVKQFFKLVKQNDIPVFLLRRSPQGAYASLSHARETRMWAKNSGNGSGGHEFVWDDKFDLYRETLDGYFRKVKTLLRAEGLSWDEFDYDEIQETRDLVGTRNRCFIRNCNFVMT